MEGKKVIAPFKLADYRVIRPTMFLEKNGNTDASVQQLSVFTINECKISFVTPNSVNLKDEVNYDVKIEDLPKLMITLSIFKQA